METIATSTAWSERLRDFSRRNAGRHTTLEIDDAEIGAQWQEMHLRLRGVDFDHRQGTVIVLLDDGERRGAHLTHSVREVTDVSILCGTDGRDEVLRIAHPGGQSLLTLDGS